MKKIIQILLLGVVVYILVSCKSSQGAVVTVSNYSDTSIVITSYNSKCKIFYKDYIDSIFAYNDSVRWNPTKSDIIKADSILIKCISTFGFPTAFIKQNINDYNRQYFGVISKSGDRIVWVNCFYNRSKLIRGNEWLNHLVGADDGGDYFFNATISFEKNTCVDMHINNR